MVRFLTIDGKDRAACTSGPAAPATVVRQSKWQSTIHHQTEVWRIADRPKT